MYIVWSSAEFRHWSGKWADANGRYKEENLHADDKLIQDFLHFFFFFLSDSVQKVICLQSNYYFLKAVVHEGLSQKR